MVKATRYMHAPGSNPGQVPTLFYLSFVTWGHSDQCCLATSLFFAPAIQLGFVAKSQSVILQGEQLQFLFIAGCNGTALNDILNGPIYLMVKESQKIVHEISDLSGI